MGAGHIDLALHICGLIGITSNNEILRCLGISVFVIRAAVGIADSERWISYVHGSVLMNALTLRI